MEGSWNMQNGRTATIVHSSPGRIRVRLAPELRTPDLMRAIVDTVAGMQGVRAVEANPTTGSVLLLHDPAVLTIDDLTSAAAAANIVLTVPDPPGSPTVSAPGGPSPLAQRINSVFGQLDGTLARVTGKRADARTLLPLGLAAIAVRQLAASGAQLGSVPWYILLWYSFEMYTKYNLTRNGTGTKSAGRVQ